MESNRESLGVLVGIVTTGTLGAVTTSDTVVLPHRHSRPEAWREIIAVSEERVLAESC